MAYKVETLFSNNMKLTSEQTLKDAKKGFETYLKTLSIPVDLLTRKDEVKHLEDRGEFDSNASTIKDSLIASLKVTDGSVRCYYATASGYLFTGKLEEVEGKLKGIKTMESGIDLTDKEWYQGSIAKEGVNGIYCYFTKPYMDEEMGELIFTVSQEVKVDGVNYGVAAMDISFDTVKEYVQEIGLLNTGFVLLADESGNILVDNQKNDFAKESLTELSFWGKAISSEEKVFSFVDNGEKVQAAIERLLDGR